MLRVRPRTAGLYVGDVLLAADGEAIGRTRLCYRDVSPEAGIGSPLQLRVLRATTVHDIAVVVGERAR